MSDTPLRSSPEIDSHGLRSGDPCYDMTHHAKWRSLFLAPSEGADAIAFDANHKYTYISRINQMQSIATKNDSQPS